MTNKPDLLAACIALNALVERMQAKAAAYLEPGGLDTVQFINDMLYLLDGPGQRAAQDAARAAIAKAGGDS